MGTSMGYVLLGFAIVNIVVLAYVIYKTKTGDEHGDRLLHIERRIESANTLGNRRWELFCDANGDRTKVEGEIGARINALEAKPKSKTIDFLEDSFNFLKNATVEAEANDTLAKVRARIDEQLKCVNASIDALTNFTVKAPESEVIHKDRRGHHLNGNDLNGPPLARGGCYCPACIAFFTIGTGTSIAEFIEMQRADSRGAPWPPPWEETFTRWGAMFKAWREAATKYYDPLPRVDVTATDPKPAPVMTECHGEPAPRHDVANGSHRLMQTITIDAICTNADARMVPVVERALLAWLADGMLDGNDPWSRTFDDKFSRETVQVVIRNSYVNTIVPPLEFNTIKPLAPEQRDLLAEQIIGTAAANCPCRSCNDKREANSYEGLTWEQAETLLCAGYGHYARRPSWFPVTRIHALNARTDAFHLVWEADGDTVFIASGDRAANDWTVSKT